MGVSPQASLERRELARAVGKIDHELCRLELKLTYRVHALERMFDREISEDDVRSVLSDGDEIAAYRNTPYPGRLVLGWCGTRAIHVVVDENRHDDELIVITAYEPQPDLWEYGFTRRRK